MYFDLFYSNLLKKGLLLAFVCFRYNRGEDGSDLLNPFDWLVYTWIELKNTVGLVYWFSSVAHLREFFNGDNE